MEKKIVEILLAEWKQEIGLSLMDSKSLCVALFSMEGNLIFANSAMSALFIGEPAESFINPGFGRFVELSEESDSELIYDGFLTLGDFNSVNTSIQVHVYHRNGELFIIGGVDVEQLDVQNKNLHHLNREINNLQRQLIKEKTTLEATLKQLNEANRELKETVATKDKLFSIVAHDLKNPFNILLGFSDLLKENASKYDQEKIREFSDNIYNTSLHTFNLLENLLSWSRLQTGKLQPSPEKLEASELVDEVVDGLQDSALSKNINLSYSISSENYIYADGEMMKTVVRNLVTNALKFTYPGGEVTVSAYSDGERMTFSVLDTGFGIESGYLDCLFEVDCKLSRNGTASEKGTGIGLILCKEFVEKNNGRIWAESTPGEGSDFKFTVPLFL